ncbi:MAG TPA: [protein-PII] uridylyltransferase [Methylophilaceae bacterium]|jgi:[protein-PII] uridylyltransferase
MSASQASREPESLAKAWRNRLQHQQEELRTAFQKNADTSRLLRQHCHLVDALLRDIWQQSTMDSQLCLIAVGGYGRGELFPYSDVDLLILLPDGADVAVSNSVETLIGLFWDIGLAVGHSVRSLDECVAEAAKDATVQTNMLEARLLTGNKQIYRRFEQAIESAMDVHAFFTAKMLEQEQRHKRHNDTAYNLEPNIKESPGGLRDLQNILWIARSAGIGDNWNALVKQGLISAVEGRQIRRHERHLQMLRTRLHYLANRREDRLLFDFQNDLAKQLGYVNTARRRASEQLMHSYYRSAKFVNLINEILLQLLKERIYPEQHELIEINSKFEARNGLLDIKSATLLQRQPSAILESFLLLQQHPTLKGMSANFLRTLHRVKNLVNREFRQDPVNKALFLQILQQKTGVTNALSLMNRYGILGRYIPAFGRIIGQMQHDLFHVYTVDEHILNVLCNLRRFVMPELAHEFPLCSKLFAAFDAPHLLYLGALFHDIAKGRGGDHSTLGTLDARRFCRAHGLSREDTNLVSWLVESHLIMSSTAQKSDLSDPDVIENFARFAGNERRLTALYLLTVADIRGTSPKVWNAWKAKLLEHLFLASQRLLRGTANNADAELQTRQHHAIKTLSHYGIVKNAYQPLWDKLGQQYFLRHESQEIAWHTRLLLSHLNTQTPVVRARLSPAGDGIQVLIYTQDRDDLFARICGFFERIGYTILEAKVHTTQHGYALDSFLVLDQSDKSVSYRDLLSYIEYELTQKLLSTSAPESPLQGRISRQVKHMPIAAGIHIKPGTNGQNHVLDIVAGDRPGLLSRLAHTFLQHNVHLHTAKINTLGNRAEDTFLISGKSGSKLDEEVLKMLEQELLTQI